VINSNNQLDVELTVNEGYAVRCGLHSDIICIDATFDRSELIDALLNDGSTPEEVFEEHELTEWAEENGFVKEE